MFFFHDWGKARLLWYVHGVKAHWWLALMGADCMSSSLWKLWWLIELVCSFFKPILKSMYSTVLYLLYCTLILLYCTLLRIFSLQLSLSTTAVRSRLDWIPILPPLLLLPIIMTTSFTIVDHLKLVFTSCLPCFPTHSSSSNSPHLNTLHSDSDYFPDSSTQPLLNSSNDRSLSPSTHSIGRHAFQHSLNDSEEDFFGGPSDISKWDLIRSSITSFFFPSNHLAFQPDQYSSALIPQHAGSDDARVLDDLCLLNLPSTPRPPTTPKLKLVSPHLVHPASTDEELRQEEQALAQIEEQEQRRARRRAKKRAQELGLLPTPTRRSTQSSSHASNENTAHSSHSSSRSRQRPSSNPSSRPHPPSNPSSSRSRQRPSSPSTTPHHFNASSLISSSSSSSSTDGCDLFSNPTTTNTATTTDSFPNLTPDIIRSIHEKYGDEFRLRYGHELSLAQVQQIYDYIGASSTKKTSPWWRWG